jgi:predicted metal-binding membrane protein
MATRAARERQRIRRPLWAIAGLAWIGLAAGSVTGLSHATMPHRTPDAAMGMSSADMSTMHNAHPGVIDLPAIVAVLAMSALMVVAMMFPLLTMPIAHIRVRSFARRRWRSTGLFLVAYTTIWTIACAIPATALWVAGNQGVNHWWLTGVTVVAAAIWQFSPAKQVWLNRSHSHPALAAFGHAADRSALRFGTRHGIRCVGSCWALMALPFVVGSWHLAAMAIAGAWIAGERLSSPTVPVWAIRVPPGVANGVRAAAMATAQRIGGCYRLRVNTEPSTVRTVVTGFRAN